MTTTAGRIVHVIQGDFAVSGEAGVTIQTLLGSCVATCMFDPVAKVGGLNHFLLPGDREVDQKRLSYGTHAMELLINTLLRAGARRSNLQAKLFGGGQISSGFTDIGKGNAAFARDFLRKESIACVAEDLGGLHARKVQFVPTTGQSRVMLVDKGEVRQAPPPKALPVNDLELF